MQNVGEIADTFIREYKKTPTRLKIIDSFLVYALLTTALQFVYMLLVGTFPFNSFLSGFFCSGGLFVFTVCLRLQVDPANKEFQNLSPERAFADYCLCTLFMFLVVWNFMG